MRIYSLELTLESPTIVTTYSDDNLLTTSTYFPGSVIRGAFINELKNRGIDIIKDEIDNPTLIFHPAFPYENDILKPAHPFIYKCKICGERSEYNPYNLLSSDYSLDLDKINRYMCKNGHLFALKSIGGELISTNKQRIVNKYVILDSLGINRVLESAEINMLYKYVALAPRQKFRSLIVVNNNKNLDIEKIDKLHIGRGISRGFGEVRVNLEDITETYKKERKEFISSMDKKIIILKALSPIFDIDENFRFRVPEIEGLKQICTIKTGYKEVSGYSMLGNIPKINVTALKEGSLLFYSTNLDNERITDILIEKELKGIGIFSSSGVNIVEVLPNDTS